MEDPAITEPDIFACIGTQRAMRRLKPDPVPEAYIQKMLWAATRAPSGANRQPWRFLVVADADKKRALGELYSQSFYASSGDFMSQLPKDAPEAVRRNAEKTYRSAKYLADHMGESPYIILVGMVPLGHQDGDVAGGSIFPAVQNLLLAARALGLGAALTTIVSEQVVTVKGMFDIPDHIAIAAQIAVGWPLGRFGEAPRKPVEAVSYRDRWGSNWQIDQSG